MVTDMYRKIKKYAEKEEEEEEEEEENHTGYYHKRIL